jgi:hypothetical protein
MIADAGCRGTQTSSTAVPRALAGRRHRTRDRTATTPTGAPDP